MGPRTLSGGTAAAILAVTAGCASASNAHHKGWFILQWTERPPEAAARATGAAGTETHFVRVLSYDKEGGAAAFAAVRGQLREGDVLAFRMSHLDVGTQLIAGGVTKLGYELLEYGHLALLVEDPDRHGSLRLFTSTTFRGPNLHDEVSALQDRNWDAYRLDQWARVDVGRLHEFVRLAVKKSGKWYGYDFGGVVGLWNFKARPRTPDDVGRSYICTTLIVAAFAYAGVELDVIRRHGIAEMITPKKVVLSRGRLIPPPEVRLTATSSPGN